MALYDENGKITIDENAAQYDVRKIQDALYCLNDSRRTLNNLIQQATQTQGETGNAITEKATELRNQIDAMIGRLNETVNFINRTVSHYQWLDQQVKEIINGRANDYTAGGGGYSSGGGGQGASGSGGGGGTR